jgi:hypothetical protein
MDANQIPHLSTVPVVYIEATPLVPLDGVPRVDGMHHGSGELLPLKFLAAMVIEAFRQNSFSRSLTILGRPRPIA